jgi:iron complex transport system ATP-binding protein
MRTEPSPGLETHGLEVGYDGASVVRDLGFAIDAGTVMSIIGPNGSGKSTILKTLARMLPPTAGSVLLDGKALGTWRTIDIARRLAALPQTHRMPEDVTVRELVSYGRFPHRRVPGNDASRDKAAVDRALERARVADFAERPLPRLSGGERQRVWLAMTLAQEPDILLLDEPTTYLDIRYQFEVLDLIRSLNRDIGLTVVMVLHDLNHAAAYSDRVIAIKDGRVAADGNPAEVIRVEVLRTVFGIEGTIVDSGGHPHFIATGMAGKEAVGRKSIQEPASGGRH